MRYVPSQCLNQAKHAELAFKRAYPTVGPCLDTKNIIYHAHLSYIKILVVVYGPWSNHPWVFLRKPKQHWFCHFGILAFGNILVPQHNFFFGLTYRLHIFRVDRLSQNRFFGHSRSSIFGHQVALSILFTFTQIWNLRQVLYHSQFFS